MTWQPWAHAGVTVLVGVMAVLLGVRVVKTTFRLVDRFSRADAPDGEETVAPHTVLAATQLRGGAVIGMLERLSIYAAVLVHFPEGIAIVLGIKGLARYPDLKAPNLGTAERFIIGTLVSVLIAVGAAGLSWWLNGLIR